MSKVWMFFLFESWLGSKIFHTKQNYSGYDGAARLHGHTYCTKLDTTLVRDILPLQTKDAPLRVAVLSPYASDETSYSKLQIAAT